MCRPRRPIIEMCIPSALDPTLAPPGKHVVTLFVQYAPYSLPWADGTLKQTFADHGIQPDTATPHPRTHFFLSGLPLFSRFFLRLLSLLRFSCSCDNGAVFSIIDEYAPNFSASVIGRDVLSPYDLEQIFGLTGGVRLRSTEKPRLRGCACSLIRIGCVVACTQNIFHGSMGLNQLYYMRPVREASGYATPLEGYFLCGSGAHPGKRAHHCNRSLLCFCFFFFRSRVAFIDAWVRRRRCDGGARAQRSRGGSARLSFLGAVHNAVLQGL